MKRQTIPMIGLLSLLILNSCSPGVGWHKIGASEQDFKKDSYECERDTLMVPAPQNPAAYNDPYKDLAASSFYVMDVGNYNQARTGMYQRCMEARGWSSSPVRNSATPGRTSEYQKWLDEHGPE